MRKRGKGKGKPKAKKEIKVHLLYQTLEMDFSLPENLSISDLKQQLYILTAIPPSSQQITGLPEDSKDETILSDLKIEDQISLTLDGEVEEEAINEYNRTLEENLFDDSAFDIAKLMEKADFKIGDEEIDEYLNNNNNNNGGDDFNGDESFYYDIIDEENNDNDNNMINKDFISDNNELSSSPSSKNIDLPNVSINEVLEKFKVDEKFINLFNERYGDSHPKFIIGPIDNVIKQSLRLGKLFLIYLHNSNHENTLSFCCETLCTPSLRNYIEEHFLFWIGNFPSKMEKFQLLNFEFSQFPVIFVCLSQPSASSSSSSSNITTTDSFSVVDVITGLMGPDEFIANLSNFV